MSVHAKAAICRGSDEPFTIENEEMTPSMKIRRHKIKDRYGERLDRLYRA